LIEIYALVAGRAAASICEPSIVICSRRSAVLCWSCGVLGAAVEVDAEDRRTAWELDLNPTKLAGHRNMH